MAWNGVICMDMWDTVSLCEVVIEEREESKGGLCGWFDYRWILVVVVAITLWCSWVFLRRVFKGDF